MNTPNLKQDLVMIETCDNERYWNRKQI